MAEKPGDALQNLTATLERVLSGREGVTIESPKHIRDVDTGRLREFDVVLTITAAHHTIVTAFECKDHKRPVDVGLIEAFATKCGRNHIHRRVFVSASGYTGTARTKAGALGITCMELRQVESFEWTGESVFRELLRQFGHMQFMCEITGERAPVEPYKVFLASGDEFTADRMLGAIQASVPTVDDPTAEPVEVQCVFEDADQLHIIDANGERFEIAKAGVLTSFEVKVTERPFELHTYEADGVRYEVARSLTTPGERPLQLMLVRDSESIRVTVAPLEGAATSERPSSAKPDERRPPDSAP